jgi:hypothetical protein
MKLDFAVERLYQTGWKPGSTTEVQSLPDGRQLPTISAIKTAFREVGLQLSIKQTVMFDCWRATWTSVTSDPTSPRDIGTVVGSSELEAALFALAHLRGSDWAHFGVKV